VLVDKTLVAAKRHDTQTIMLAGGVAANKLLREQLSARAIDNSLRLINPPLVLCTDNAAMIACAAYYKYRRGDFAPLSLNAVPGLPLGQDRY